MIDKTSIVNAKETLTSSTNIDDKTPKYVLFIEENGKNGYVVLDKEVHTVGRSSSNSIVLQSSQVSRIHATIYRQKTEEKSAFFIQDGNQEGKRSFNGIFMHNKKVDVHQLQHGDVIHIGTEVTLTFYVSYDVENLLNNQKTSFPSSKVEEEFNKINQSLGEAFDGRNISDISTFTPDCKETLTEIEDEEFLKLSSILELCPNPIVEIDYKGKITYSNPCTFLIFNDLAELQERHPLVTDILEKKETYKGEIFKREVTIKKDIYEQFVHYLPEQNLIRFYLFNITQRKKLEQNLLHNAYYDALTDLPNRRFFDKLLRKNIANAKRKKLKFGILFLDIDRFKFLNDTLGHKSGDQLLRKFSDKLQKVVREEDVVFRWGGDEFTVLIPEITDLQEIISVAQRIIDLMKKPITLHNEEYYLTTSIGIAIYPDDGDNPEVLTKNADVALYDAKLSGKNQYRFYKSQSNTESQEFLKLENFLHKAVQEKQFFLEYLPQVNVKTGQIETCEALLRWNHPVKGVVMPNDFISVAEEIGLMIPITEWVIDTVCEQNSLWQKENHPDIRIAVNISTSLFKNWNLTDTVIKSLDKYNLPAHLLELEITENTMISNMQGVRENFIKLLKKGVKITMDDFGSGHSSLINLKQIPFHFLKINQSFVKELINNTQDKAIISAIVTMAKGFNMKVIAEGVETQENYRLLTELGCDYIQGYLLSKPLATENVMTFINQF